MGSGTTLLRLIVDSHDDIAIAQETSIMRAYLAHRWIPFHRHGGDWYGRLGFSDDELDERMREFYGGMFERWAASQGKKRWGDKTPWHAWQLREIARLFPDAVVLATVRHPGAVAASVSSRFRLGWGGAVAHWINTETELVQRGRDLGDRFLLVRYEDLVLDPASTLREIFDWLDATVVGPVAGAPRRAQRTRRTARRSRAAPAPTRRSAPSASRPGPRRRPTRTSRPSRRRSATCSSSSATTSGDPDALTPLTVDGSPRRRH